MANPKMTLRDVCVDMRSRGFKIKADTLSKGIVAGVFPFGTVLGTGKSGRTTFLIIRRNYEEWADKYIGPVCS